MKKQMKLLKQIMKAQMMAIVTRPTHVLNLSSLRQQQIRSFQVTYNHNRDDTKDLQSKNV